MRLFKRKEISTRSILFVCTANITRSPVAEAMFRKLAEEAGDKWEVNSAGVKGVRGAPANPVISFIMHRRNNSIQNHRSQPFTKKLFRKYFWIIVMEESHRKSVLKLDESMKERVLLFRKLTVKGEKDSLDMPDPTGKEVDDYQELFKILGEETPILYAKMMDKSYEAELQRESSY